MMQNPVTYFEIPVKDMGRAIEFYEAVFAVALDVCKSTVTTWRCFRLMKNAKAFLARWLKARATHPQEVARAFIFRYRALIKL